MSKVSSHFSLTGDHIFRLPKFSKKCRKKVCTFRLEGLQKNAKSKFALFICRESKETLALNFLLTLTTKKACLGATHQKLKLSITPSTNELWLGESSLWWANSLWIGSSGKLNLFSTARSVVHTSAPNRLSAPQLGLAL